MIDYSADFAVVRDTEFPEIVFTGSQTECDSFIASSDDSSLIVQALEV